MTRRWLGLLGVLVLAVAMAVPADARGFLGIGDGRPGVFGIGDHRPGALGIGDGRPGAFGVGEHPNYYYDGHYHYYHDVRPWDDVHYHSYDHHHHDHGHWHRRNGRWVYVYDSHY